jgi:hypothetical protein
MIANSVVAACLWLTVGGTEIIEEGRYKYLEIGASKEEVIKALSSQGVDYILPVPEETITVNRENLDQLDLLHGSPGIVLRGGEGIRIELAFDNQVVVDVDSSVVTEEEIKRRFFIGQSEIDAFDVMHSVIEDDHTMRVFNILPDARWTRVENISSRDIEYLKNYSVWSFRDREYWVSHYVLEFREDRLLKITHTWSPTEFP